MPEKGHRLAPVGRLHTRGWLFGVLLSAMAASALLQFGLGVLAPFITEEFSLTRAQYGSAATVLFLSGLLVSLPAGRLVGRWGDVRLLRMLYALTVVAFALVATAPGWAWVLLGAAVMGVPLGLGNPVTNELIVTRVGSTVHGTATGIKQSGVQVGALFAGVALPPVAVAYGWRTAVGMLAVVALLGLALSLPLRQRPAGSGSTGSTGAADGASRRVSPLALFLGAYAVLMGFGASAVNAFLPLFAYEELGMPASRAGRLIAVIGLLGAGSRVVMGVIGNRVRRFELWLAGLATAAAVSGALLFASVNRSYLVWIVVVGFGVSAAAWQTAAMLTIVREARETARESGVVIGGFLAGMMLGPLIFGWLTDATHSYLVGWGVVVAAFGAAVLLSVTTAVLTHTRSP